MLAFKVLIGLEFKQLNYLRKCEFFNKKINLCDLQ